MRQPCAKDCGLDLVEPRVHAELIVVVPATLAAVSKTPDSIRQRSVTRDDGAAVTEGAEVFCGIEAECAGRADGADRTAARRGEMGLAAVFDDRQAVP